MKPALRKTLRYTAIVLLLLFVTSFCYALYLRWFPPVTTPLMVMRALGPKEKDDWQLRARWRGYEDISANAKLAVIASEDQNFAFHHGFDYEAIEKAMKHNKKGKKIRGASTISQQVAKNVFLWPGRSWIRKGFEVYFTFLIETLWSKERILTMYLNVAEMGDGIFGVEAASQRYFKKPAAALSPAQGAMLAAILPNPRKYNALKPSSYVRGRQIRIQRFMRGIGGTAYLKNL